MLVLSNDDSPAVVVNDNWRADPALAFTCKPDGSEALQAEHRLIGRVQNQDLRLQVAEAQVGDLQERLRKARYETKVCASVNEPLSTTRPYGSHHMT